jgi:glycosyltransferase involved in cell wall biosynthesis
MIFADPAGYSGQRSSALLLAKALENRAWHVDYLPTPALDRTTDVGWFGVFRYVLRLIVSWLQAMRILRHTAPLVYVTFGQTVNGLLRDGVPFVVVRLLRPGGAGFVAIHGSRFLEWQEHSQEARLFRMIARLATSVTVLGEGHRSKLMSLRVPAAKIAVVPNTCEVEPVVAAVARRKHGTVDTVKILHLSSLIASKGYPVFLEALQLLAEERGPAVEAVLCGTVLISEYNDFPSEAAARVWIEERVARINRSARISVRWIKGAVGAEKERLFAESHIFVLPTTYPVEAQPLVLLEAMATGCAIVSSAVGEIATILSEREATLLPSVDAVAVASAMRDLIDSPERRLELAEAARRRFETEFSLKRHVDAWVQLLAREER